MEAQREEPSGLLFILHLTRRTYYRKKAGYTQAVFAEKIGKSVNFISKEECTGTVRGVSLETLFKIADVLGIPPSKLLEDD